MGQYRAAKYRRYRKKEEGSEKTGKSESIRGEEEKGETIEEVGDKEEIILDVRKYKDRYHYVLLAKDILKRIGIEKPGIYKFTLETRDGKITEIFREITKIRKHVILIPKKYSESEYLKLVNYEKYTLETVLLKLDKLKRRGKIKYRITKDDKGLYLYLDNYKAKVEHHTLKPYTRALFLDIDIRISPTRILTLRISIYDDSSDLSIKRSKDNYIKVLDIKSTNRTVSLSYSETRHGNKVTKYINIVPLEYHRDYEELIRRIISEIKEYEFLKEYNNIKIYEYRITEIGKSLIDFFLDKTYNDYFIEGKGFGQEVKNIRENLGIELAINFLTSLGWKYKDKYIIDPKSRKGFDLYVTKDDIGYLFEVKITEPSYRNKAIKRAKSEIREQAYKFYSNVIDNISSKIKYIGFVVITFHYSWRRLNEYKVYFWVERYEKR